METIGDFGWAIRRLKDGAKAEARALIRGLEG